MAMEAKEIITVGFGNYSTLVAAQWANSTSQYDVQHSTLYSERQRTSVYGGCPNSRGRVRVPRLVLLDAPHAVRLEELHDAAERERAAHLNEEQDSEEERDLSELLRGGGGAVEELVPGDGGQLPQPLQRLAQKMVQRTPWDWREAAGYNREKEFSDEEEEDSASDREEEWQHGASGQRNGASQRHANPNSRGESWFALYGDGSLSAQQDAAADNHAMEECTEGVPSTGASTGKRTALERAKRRVLQQRDTVVPWWHYISTGLSKDSVITLRPPQQAETAGNIPAAHSFGFGLSHLRPGSSSVEMEQLLDQLRLQLEDADAVQGLQVFVDVDSMFGGAAHNALEAFWEEAGNKTPAIIVAPFQPLPECLTDPQLEQETPFAALRREERHLNRLLATSRLSQHTSAVYLPLELEHWGSFFSGAGASVSSSSLSWLEDDRATAQYIAAMTDTALYGARDGGNPCPASEDLDEWQRANGRHALPPAIGKSNGPAYTLREWSRTIRPSNSMRVAAMLGSLPLRLRDSRGVPKELWSFLESTPLLGAAAQHASAKALSRDPDAVEVEPEMAGQFVPLTHAMPYSPLEDQGRVVGHAVSLRGAGAMPSSKYSAQEAMLRYAIPLRTGTYLPLLTRAGLPLSGSFPLSLLFPTPSSMPAGGEEMIRGGLSAVDVGAHTVCTYASAEMLHNTVEAARRLVSPKYQCRTRHQHETLYELCTDEWMEVLEDVTEMYDDYHHGPPTEEEDFDNEY